MKNKPKPEKIGIEPRLVEIAKQLQISYSSLFGTSRRHAIVSVRYCIWLYLHHKLEYSQESIGSIFKKNPSSVCYGIFHAGYRAEKRKDYKEIYTMVKNIFESL